MRRKPFHSDACTPSPIITAERDCRHNIYKEKKYSKNNNQFIAFFLCHNITLPFPRQDINTEKLKIKQKKVNKLLKFKKADILEKYQKSAFKLVVSIIYTL